MDIEKFASIIAAATAREVIKYAGAPTPPAGAAPQPAGNPAAQRRGGYTNEQVATIMEKAGCPKLAEIYRESQTGSIQGRYDQEKAVIYAEWPKFAASEVDDETFGNVKSQLVGALPKLTDRNVARTQKKAAEVEQMAKKAAKRAYDTIKNKYASEVPAFARPDFVKASSKKSISNLMKVAKKFK